MKIPSLLSVDDRYFSMVGNAQHKVIHGAGCKKNNSCVAKTLSIGFLYDTFAAQSQLLSTF